MALQQHIESFEITLSCDFRDIIQFYDGSTSIFFPMIYWSWEMIIGNEYTTM